MPPNREKGHISATPWYIDTNTLPSRICSPTRSKEGRKASLDHIIYIYTYSIWPRKAAHTVYICVCVIYIYIYSIWPRDTFLPPCCVWGLSVCPCWPLSPLKASIMELSGLMNHVVCCIMWMAGGMFIVYLWRRGQRDRIWEEGRLVETVWCYQRLPLVLAFMRMWLKFPFLVCIQCLLMKLNEDHATYKTHLLGHTLVVL